MNDLGRIVSDALSGTALDPDLQRQVARVCTALEAEGRLSSLVDLVASLRRRGDVEAVCRVVDGALSLAEVCENTAVHAHLLYMRARMERDRGDVLVSIDTALAARARFEVASDPRGLGLCDNTLGVAYARLHQWVLAQHYLERALLLANEAHSIDLDAAVRNNLALVFSRQGRWTETLRIVRSLSGMPLEEHQRLTHRLHLGRVLRSLGFATRAAGELERAARAAQDLKAPRALALATEYLGEVLLDRGASRDAKAVLDRCLKVSISHAPLGDVTCEAYCRLAELHLLLGEIERSQKALAEGLRLADRLHDDYERVGLLRVQAGLALEGDDLVEADRLYHKAALLALSHGFRFEHALTLETQGFAHRSTARPDTADRFIKEAKAIYDELGLTRLALRLGRGVRALSRPRPRKAPTPISQRAKPWERFGIHTRSHRFIAMLEEVRTIAGTKLSVLMIGESGVGKELIVEALHAMSDRPGRLVAVNCAAIPETMLESELFGSRRGAFTGAENRDGVVVEADGGTLFLDEIGDTPPALQAKLLRFLEKSSFRPVGAKGERRVDVRFVSATNADLERRVRKGTFRQDLYHRIAGDVIAISPLRGRPEDIEFLASHFLRVALGPTETALPAFDETVIKAFRAYGWPGNIRELKNAIERAAFRVGSRKVISASLLPERILRETGYDLERSRDVQQLTEAVVENRGNISDAARSLGISRQTLYRKAERLGMDLDAIRGA